MDPRVPAAGQQSGVSRPTSVFFDEYEVKVVTYQAASLNKLSSFEDASREVDGDTRGILVEGSATAEVTSHSLRNSPATGVMRGRIDSRPHDNGKTFLSVG